VEPVIIAFVVLSLMAAIFAVIIYFVDKQFHVEEDPRIDLIAEKLPGANCGGCGYAGCRNFAEAIVKNNSLDGLFCAPGGNKVMSEIAELMNLTAEEKKPQVAVIRCQGSFENCPPKHDYNGIKNCGFANFLFAGKGGCAYGCLGLGDCVEACKFDALYMDPITGLPVVIEDNCTACGNCVKACPRNIIELRNKGPKNRRIYVACMNKEKGIYAKANCLVACIGCNACAKECKFDAIKIENFLAYIDYKKCTLCRKCVAVCPTNCILEVNFLPKKQENANIANDSSKNIVNN